MSGKAVARSISCSSIVNEAASPLRPRQDMILNDLAKPRPLGFNRRTYQRPKARGGPTNIKIPNERGEMNLILNRLKLLDRRRQQKARVCDQIDSIAPSGIS